MNIELTPVIELTNYSEDIKTPDKSPYWEYADEWEAYHQACNEKAGFTEKLKSYAKGSAFYKLTDITDDNLSKVVVDHTLEMRNGNYDREQACPLYGGCVLVIDGQDKFFPQCCGDLSDIGYYERLVTLRNETFYQGHPQPTITFFDDIIEFDFSIGEFDERFVPTITELKLNIEIAKLKIAVDKAKFEMSRFAERIKNINNTKNLNIIDIDKLLVWGDD